MAGMDPQAFVDATGVLFRLREPARRVVSLVPSDTESVAVLAGLSALVGRTAYCEEPAGQIEAVPSVGGTKRVDVERIVALAPDLVLANREENTKADVERLRAAGMAVHVAFPCSLAETVVHLRRLGTLLGAPDRAAVHADALARALVTADDTIGRPRVFVPIWKDPWMTFDRRTYGHDVVQAAGATNVFADRARRYPLAADLGAAEPKDAADRDTRYPRVSRAEVEAQNPDEVWLPDEPFGFGPEHVDALLGWSMRAAETRAIHLVSGKDLFWFGVRSAPGLRRLKQLRRPAKRTRTGRAWPE